jgi:hypothetical protein
MSNNGVITREDIFKQDAINAPKEYADNLQLAIKNTEKMIEIAKQYNSLSSSAKKVSSTRELIKVQQQHLGLTEQTQIAYKEQNRLEKNLITTKVRQELATESTNRALIKERTELNAVNRLIKEEITLNSNLIGAYQKLNLKRTQAAKKLQDLIASGKASRIEIRLATKQFEKYNAKVKKADLAIGNFSKNVGNYKSAFKGLGGTIRNLVGAFGFTSGIFIFSSLVKGAFNRIREFDKSMQNLSGILRVSRKDLKDLEGTIIDVAGSSVKTSNEVATLAEKLTTLGKTKDEVKALLKPVVDLGIGLETTGEEAGEFLVQMLNTFGASTDEAGKYADIIATIRTSTSLDFQKMRDSFQYLAPISKALNKDLAYTGALVGILADNGIKAERAGRLMGTSQQKLASVGKSLNDGLNELNEAKSRGVTELELLALSSKLFGKQSSALGLVLANNTDLIETNAQVIRDNGGALEDLVNEQLESMDAKLKILDSSWEELILMIENGEGSLSNSFKGFIETITFAIQRTTELEKAQSKLAKIGVEKSGWRGFFDTILPGLGLISSGYDKAEEAQLRFNKTNKGIEKNGISILNIMRDQLFHKVRFNNLSKEEEKTYLNQIKVIEETIVKKREERKSIEDAAIELGFNKKELGKYSDNISDYTNGDLKNFIEANKESTKVIIKETEAQKKLREEREKATKNKLDKSNNKAEFQLAQEQIKVNIDKNKKIATDNTRSFENHLKANIALKNDLIKLNDNQIKEEKRLLKEKLDNDLISEIEYNVRLQILALKKQALNEDVNDTITKNLESHLEYRFNKEQESLDKITKEKKEAASKQLVEDKKTADKRKEIIQETSSFIANALGLDAGRISSIIENLMSKNISSTEKWKTSLMLVGETMQTITNIASQFSQARIDAIDVEIEKNDEKFNLLLANENITEEQRSLLEAQKQREQDKLEKKKRAEKTKQAKLEKANAIAQIAIQTALAVTTALPIIPLAIAVGAIGVVQLALAAATPIPKFKDGHLAGTHQGWAITNDGGKQEVLERNNTPYLIQGVNTPLFMNKGDKIYKSEEDYHKRVANNAFRDLNHQQKRVQKAQQLSANDNKINENYLAFLIGKEISKQNNSNISKEIKQGFKGVKVQANFTGNSGNTLYENNDW